MPLYEYQCVKCGKRTEKIESVSGPHLKKCPHCGGKVERMLTAPAIQFKGSGWYVTDYAAKPAAKEGPSDDKARTESKEAPAKEPAGKESPGKESREKKPARKK